MKIDTQGECPFYKHMLILGYFILLIAMSGLDMGTIQSSGSAYLATPRGLGVQRMDDLSQTLQEEVKQLEAWEEEIRINAIREIGVMLVDAPYSIVEQVLQVALRLFRDPNRDLRQTGLFLLDQILESSPREAEKIFSFVVLNPIGYSGETWKLQAEIIERITKRLTLEQILSVILGEKDLLAHPNAQVRKTGIIVLGSKKQAIMGQEELTKRIVTMVWDLLEDDDPEVRGETADFLSVVLLYPSNSLRQLIEQPRSTSDPSRDFGAGGFEFEFGNDPRYERRTPPFLNSREMAKVLSGVDEAMAPIYERVGGGYYWNAHFSVLVTPQQWEKWQLRGKQFKRELTWLIHLWCYVNNSVERSLEKLLLLHNNHLITFRTDIQPIAGQEAAGRMHVAEASIGHQVTPEYWAQVIEWIGWALMREPSELRPLIRALQKIYREEGLYLTGERGVSLEEDGTELKKYRRGAEAVEFDQCRVRVGDKILETMYEWVRNDKANNRLRARARERVLQSGL